MSFPQITGFDLFLFSEAVLVLGIPESECPTSVFVAHDERQADEAGHSGYKGGRRETAARFRDVRALLARGTWVPAR